jgi:ATP-binding cassette, subfamily B, bacterial
VKFYKQYDAMDCGPTCLRMIAKVHGKSYSLEYLRGQSFITKQGVSLLGISEAAEQIGYRTLAVKVPLQKLVDDAPLPAILHWNQNHFVVLHKITGRGSNRIFHVADPGHGLLQLSQKDLLASWQMQSTEGIALLLEPTPKFYAQKLDDAIGPKGFSFLWAYLLPHKAQLFQLLISVAIGSSLSLVFPFLTQAIVDHGINSRNVNFVVMILIAQLALFAGSTVIELIRSWIMLHMNSKINIVLISDFLIKLMRLPINYFDTKLVGDIQQRIGDHHRIQGFLTGSALSTFFSLFNIVVFSVVLAMYSLSILAVFMLFSVLGILWIVLFLRRRKKLDYVRFRQQSDNENLMVEMISAMQEIKLNNCETHKRWNWERLQAKMYKLSIAGLNLAQYQQIGSTAFNQVKNILISYLAAREVIAGNMTLGMMMSVTYIVGQLNGPIQGLLSFIQAAQDAKLSLDRLSEVHNQADEDEQAQQLNKGNTKSAPFTQDGIRISNLSFHYQGSNSPAVLTDINLHIPKGKVTAIVGASGSGKTTLLKLLLGYYKPSSGAISIDGVDLPYLLPRSWRAQCGTVMQDGHIFSDTIANNIAMADEFPNHTKLANAVDTANIKSFIEEQPLNYNTMIGAAGTGISAGQKQRILIARAVYKDPDYLFFDEATSALDANNEKEINEKLQRFYNDKTVLIVAHRLSTVKNADQIVVLDKGIIAEQGSHTALIASKGLYYELIKNQLELGN